MSDLTAIPNIGPATAQALIAAGIPDAKTLHRIGADAAYRALLAAGGRPHFIGYYVLHMALQGRPWNDCRGEEKARLRAGFDALVAQMRGGSDSALDRALREIGLVPAPPNAAKPSRTR